MALFPAISILKRKKKSPPLPQEIWQDPYYFIAFGFGCGAMPFAPGTFGTLMAIPFYLLCRPLPLIAYLLLTLCLIVVSSYICGLVSKKMQVHDHPGICLDEIVGFFVTMIHAPAGIIWIIVGFLLFRLFDVWKPWPIRLLDQHVHGGFGIVIDDVLAGIYACLIMQILIAIF